ncbi:glucan endo-1,6-beta-glucosidase [Hymenobacter sp. 15J16-1T3B]|uniref:glycoside hydrolase family 30 protein n=1 Tax=Hymenobacter sp. 15J16-1T3B TaxID=2886941 RepID=UPI001D0F57AD|nr:glycoside hydrolase family 30 beta sandwich domain-containing protein [Hymenobacter sp. 15J16-1T3B]MCC3156694.1 glucan endo-1,6-beta-glucosidase [Hymenobacter sp. 15J16-1T3B]
MMNPFTPAILRGARPWLAAGLLAALALASCRKDPGNGPGPAPQPPAPPTTSEVDAWLTTPEQSGARLTKQPDALSFATAPGDANVPVLEVSTAQQYQTIDGFGAALTGSAAYLLQRKLNAAQREALLQDLFTTTGNGIGLSYLRMSIGSSDFSLGNYSYDDPPAGQPDPTLAYFSIAPDQADLLPTLQQIWALNAGVKLLGSPWSAPAWMKSSQSMIRGRLNPSAYPAFAQYFVKYVQAFGAAGVPVDAITVQNEPLYEPAGYPGMLMSAAEQTDFIKNHLGPAFSAHNITAKIIAYDHNWDHPEYPITVLNDAAARRYVAGSAFHGYGGSVPAMTTVHDAHPDKDLYFTEQSGGQWAPSFADNLRGMTRDLIIGTTRNWSRNVLLWNLALDENYGPINGGCANCRGVVTIAQTSGTVTRNVEYYVLGHASRFVRPGAVRVASTASSAFPNVAFLNPDGSKVLLVLNDQSQTQSFRLKYNGKYLGFTLPAGAVVTFKWSV